MTAWGAIQNSIDAGDQYVAELDAESLDEIEQLADTVKITANGKIYTGTTPDGDSWSVYARKPE